MENGTHETHEAEGREEKTFTQEQVNQIVEERLRRDREKYTKYGDLEEISKKARLFDEQEEASKSELQKVTERAGELQRKLDEALHNAKVADLRRRIADETGVPVSLLNCDTEEDLKEQATNLLKFRNAQSYPDVRDEGEPNEAHGRNKTTAEQFADWLGQVSRR